MAQKKETTFKKRVAADLDKLPNCWYEKIQQVALRGTPDFLCCINGKFVALELKKDDKSKLSKLQHYKLDAICKAGGCAWTVIPADWDECLEALRSL